MRSSSSGIGGSSGGRIGTINGGVDKEVDFANYFCTYAFLYHQKEMLSDRVRMDAYYNSIMLNKHHFIGKCVLDVGTGSGILAIWSAQAGARKVYAVEATKMSEHARALVKANNLEDVVEVIEGSIEDVTLPEKGGSIENIWLLSSNSKNLLMLLGDRLAFRSLFYFAVDVIISEWMGYFLLRESMFDSVICARDRWLKPTGVMYPSHARMWMAPIVSGLVDQKLDEYEGSMEDWYYFADEMQNDYGVNMNILSDAYSEEQKKYFLQTTLWSNLHPNQVVGTPSIIKEIDCSTVTVNEILEVRSNFSTKITEEDARLCALGGWFDVHFRGSDQNPAQQEIELTTAPSVDQGTHWGQQVFLLHPPVNVSEGDELSVSFVMVRSKENHRLMEVDLDCEVKQVSGQPLKPIRKKFFIE